MKIKLIYPPSNLIVETIVPYGISILNSILRKNSYEVDIEDLAIYKQNIMINGKSILQKNLNANIFRQISELHKYLFYSISNKKINRVMEEVVRYINIDKYDLVGFSIFSYYQLYSALLLAKYFKKIKPKIITVCGGAYSTLYWKLFFNEAEFLDYLIPGNGEIPLLKLINYLEGKINIKDIPNLVYRNGNRIYVNESDGFNIKDESIPDFTGMPLKLYKIPVQDQNILVLPYRISSGCINRCSFCIHHHNKSIQIKPLSKVINELREMTSKYNSNYVYFCDDLLNFSHKYLEEFCNLLVGSGFQILWGGNCTAHNVDKKLLQTMKKAGCSFIEIGIESGSPKILKEMEKSHTVEQASQFLKDSYSVGIKNYIFLMAGYPHENRNDISLTVEFITRNSRYIYWGDVFKFVLMPDSPIFNYPESYGIQNIKRLNRYISFENYSFDEINGLEWEEKLRQQKSSFKVISKIFYKKVKARSKVYRIRHIPFALYIFISNLFLKGRFYKLFIIIICLFFKKRQVYSKKYSILSSLY